MTCPNILLVRFNNFNEEINAAEQFSVSDTLSGATDALDLQIARTVELVSTFGTFQDFRELKT